MDPTSVAPQTASRKPQALLAPKLWMTMVLAVALLATGAPVKSQCHPEAPICSVFTNCYHTVSAPPCDPWTWLDPGQPGGFVCQGKCGWKFCWTLACACGEPQSVGVCY